jgi:hypothetical protein
MNSDEKFWITIWGMIATTAIIIVVAMYSYSVQVMPVTRMRVISEHNLKLSCIQHGGNWEATDHDNQSPYSCKTK